MHLMVIYDIRSDRVRRRVADACLDFGLERLQYSVFVGRIDPSWRPELQRRLESIAADAAGRIDIFTPSRATIRERTRLGAGLE